MTATIRCDICNRNLELNETKFTKSMLGAGKLASKYAFKTEFEGAIRLSELCLNCAINLRNFVESEKLRFRK